MKKASLLALPLIAAVSANALAAVQIGNTEIDANVNGAIINAAFVSGGSKTETETAIATILDDVSSTGTGGPSVQTGTVDIDVNLNNLGSLGLGVSVLNATFASSNADNCSKVYVGTIGGSSCSDIEQ